MALTKEPARARKAPLEQLIIGPSMVLGEMLTGGHYFEMLKIKKQIGEPYLKSIRTLWVEEGIMGCYKGFMPWGFLQIVKGLPVLYTADEVDHYLKDIVPDNQTRKTLSGIAGGVAQGAFVTPTQRLKTIVMSDPKYAGKDFAKLGMIRTIGTTSRVIVDIGREEGIATLFKGLTPMMTRRGIDWGLRFYGASWMKTYLTGGEKKNETPLIGLFSGFFGGVCSTLTMPVDVIISNAQKSGSGKGKGRVSLVEVIRGIYAEGGYNAFVRGWVMRTMHAGYHTAWMVYGGTVLTEWWRGGK